MSLKQDNFRSASPTNNSMSGHSDSPFGMEVPKLQDLPSMHMFSQTSQRSLGSQPFGNQTHNIASETPKNVLSSNVLLSSKLSSTIPTFTAPPPSRQANNIYLNDRAYNPVQVDFAVPPPSCHSATWNTSNFETLDTRPPDRIQGEFKDIPQDIHVKCLEILKENPMGLYIDDFKMAFEQRNNNVPLNYTRYGYRNLQDCLSTMTNCLRINVNPNNNIIVLPSPQFCEEWASQIRAKQKCIEKIRKTNPRETNDNDQADPSQCDPNSTNSAFTSSDIRKYKIEDNPPVSSKVSLYKYKINFRDMKFLSVVLMSCVIVCPYLRWPETMSLILRIHSFRITKS